MKILSAATVISVTFLMAWTRNRLQQWDDAMAALEDHLLLLQEQEVAKNVLRLQHTSYGEPQPQPQQQQLQLWEELPAVVQRYLTLALPVAEEEERDLEEKKTTLVPPQFLRVTQSGTFQSSPESDGTVFSARQLVATNPPGFVWDATIDLFAPTTRNSISSSSSSSSNTMPWWRWWKSPTVRVCDAYVGEQGILKAALLGIWEVPILPKSTMEDREDEKTTTTTPLWERQLRLGEAIRWLAEAVLVPFVLLPSAGQVAWRSAQHHEDEGDENSTTTSNSAFLQFHHHHDKSLSEARVRVTFDPHQGFPVLMEGLRPKFVAKKESFVMTEFVGGLSDYESVDFRGKTYQVPTRMRAGWRREDGDDDDGDDGIDWYFEGHNIDLEFFGGIVFGEDMKTDPKKASTKSD